MELIKVQRTFTNGVAIGNAFVYKPLCLDAADYIPESAEIELDKFKAAVKKATTELEELAKNSDIFSAHVDLVQDPTIEEYVTETLEKGVNIEKALAKAIEDIASEFEAIEDEYLNARAVDMRDIGKRIMMKLKGISSNPFEHLNEHTIVIARDLAPSDTSLMDFDKIDGFVTEQGGVTSHVCIIARSLAVPAIVGAEGIMSLVSHGDTIALNAGSGEIAVNPDDETLKKFSDEKASIELHAKEMMDAVNEKSVTLDGKFISVCANVGGIEDIENALKYNPDGVGLFRTEFLYMHSKDFPSEDEQFEVYKKAAELMGERELIIRTLDIGGDKGLSYFDFGCEENPFLGYRAIRICLRRKDVFKTQLRALLRASAYGNIKIMFPMIISEAELDEALCVAEECKSELKAQNEAFNEDIEIGIMVETPAAVIMADELAKKSAFFSIGTNDLTQYVLCVDRGNKNIAEMYDSFNVAVMRSIEHIIKSGHDNGIKVGMCGEFASDLKAFPVLLNMGLDEFSVSAPAIPSIRAEVRKSKICP